MSFVSDFKYGIKNRMLIDVLIHWAMNFIAGFLIGGLVLGIPTQILKIFIYFPQWIVLTVFFIGGMGTFIYFVETEPMDRYLNNTDK